jgi:hypothetical protein
LDTGDRVMGLVNSLRTGLWTGLELGLVQEDLTPPPLMGLMVPV